MKKNKYLTSLLAAFIFFSGSLEAFYHPIRVEDYLPPNNSRYKTFKQTLKLLDERRAKVLVETGTARGGKSNLIGDGGSTLIFGDWASENGALLYSVDIDLNALHSAERDLKPKTKNYVHFVHGDSIQFLKQFGKTIDFLYLDSYDFELHNPNPSQEHHLKEIEAAYPWLSDKSVILIDDCGLPFGGKGKLVIQYLLDRGWKIALKGYQVLLVKN